MKKILKKKRVLENLIQRLPADHAPEKNEKGRSPLPIPTKKFLRKEKIFSETVKIIY
jgi:hypothetical protein